MKINKTLILAIYSLFIVFKEGRSLMRLMLFSTMAFIGITALGYSGQKSSDEVTKNAEEIIENMNTTEFDPIIIGQTISQEHLENWKEHNRKNAECSGCLDLSQPYPGDKG